MNQEAGIRNTSRPKRRSRFNPTVAGCIEGLRLAAWTIEKTLGMVELYREKNSIQPPEPDTAKDGVSKITDPRDPVSGYLCARLIMRSLGIELALKQIALLSYDDGRGALNTHDLLELWEDLPEETRGLLEKRFRSEVKVYRVPRDAPRAFKTEERPTIKEVCEWNRHGFIDARYISEARPRPFTTMTDDDLKGVLMFLSDWILGKMGYAAASVPADDATLQVRYEPNPTPIP